MSAYSGLILAANHGLGDTTINSIEAVLPEAGMIESSRSHIRFYNLADDIIALFEDEEAKAANERFFTPDHIGVDEGFKLTTADRAYEIGGFRIVVAGQGYFWPWTHDHLANLVTNSPKLMKLRELLNRQIGGEFVFPGDAESLLKKQWIAGDSGWMWFGFESY